MTPRKKGKNEKKKKNPTNNNITKKKQLPNLVALFVTLGFIYHNKGDF